ELRELGAAVADHLVLERDLAEGSAQRPGYAADLDTLDRLSLRIEQLVLGEVSAVVIAPEPERDLAPEPADQRVGGADLVPALAPAPPPPPPPPAPPRPAPPPASASLPVVPEFEPARWLTDEPAYSTGPFFGPALELAARTGTAHGVAWLPDR